MSFNGLWCTAPYSCFWKISASIRSMRDTTSGISSPINPILPSPCICCWNFSFTCHRWPSTIMHTFVFNSTRNPHTTIDVRTNFPTLWAIIILLLYTSCKILLVHNIFLLFIQTRIRLLSIAFIFEICHVLILLTLWIFLTAKLNWHPRADAKLRLKVPCGVVVKNTPVQPIATTTLSLPDLNRESSSNEKPYEKIRIFQSEIYYRNRPKNWSLPLNQQASMMAAFDADDDIVLRSSSTSNKNEVHYRDAIRKTVPNIYQTPSNQSCEQAKTVFLQWLARLDGDSITWDFIRFWQERIFQVGNVECSRCCQALFSEKISDIPREIVPWTVRRVIAISSISSRFSRHGSSVVSRLIDCRNNHSRSKPLKGLSEFVLVAFTFTPRRCSRLCQANCDIRVDPLGKRGERLLGARWDHRADVFAQVVEGGLDLGHLGLQRLQPLVGRLLTGLQRLQPLVGRLLIGLERG